MMPDLKAAGAIIYLKSDDEKEPLFLLLRSAKHGEWGPPKGHADPGETDMEAAAREIFEEAGVRRACFASDFREVLNYNVERKGKLRSKEVVYFICGVDDADGIQLSHEHTEWHWATLDEIEVLLPHERMKAVFRKAHDYLAAMRAKT